MNTESLRAQSKVLVLDDDEIILLAIEQSLGNIGYEVVSTASPRHALELLGEQEFAVIITDQRMKEMNGMQFLKAAKEINTEASRILITGVLNIQTLIDSVNKGEIFRFLAKPWKKEDLHRAVDEAAERYLLSSSQRRMLEDTRRQLSDLEASYAGLARQLSRIRAEAGELLGEEAARKLEALLDE